MEMIGNNLPTDVTGGHHAALTTIWIADTRLAEIARERDRGMFAGQVPDFVAATGPDAVEILLGQHERGTRSRKTAASA